MARKKPDREEIAKALPRIVGKALELGWSPSLSNEESKAALEAPKVVYCKLGDIWGPWKRGKSGNQGGFTIEWGVEKVGYGEITFVIKDGKTICDTECMGPAFVKAVLLHFLANSVIYDPKGEEVK